MEENKKSLGRVCVLDQRDGNYPLSSIIKNSTIKTKRDFRYWWAAAWWGDQGNRPHCVAYSWLHWLEDGPVTHFYKNRNFNPHFLNERRGQKQEPLFDPEKVYKEAQKVDEWEGTDYDGTSVRAGAKILRNLNVISEFRWATTLDEVIYSILNLGPMVVGTWWYSGMITPDENGLIKATGQKLGGHAYVINGVNVKNRIFRIKNSWGREWGKAGHAYISFDDFEKLLKDWGEACIAFEKKLE